MLDDYRLEWFCQKVCHLFNVDRTIFVEMLQRNNGFNEDLIDSFLNMNTDLHERSFALIFYREDSTRQVWQMISIIEDEDFDEDNDQEMSLTVNQPIHIETEYPSKYAYSNLKLLLTYIFLVDFVFNHASLSTGDIIDSLYEDLHNIQRLIVINQFDNKRYQFGLVSIDEVRLFCEYRDYQNCIKKKNFVYFIRINIQQYLTQLSTFNETNDFMNNELIYGTIADDQPFSSLLDILSFIFSAYSFDEQLRSSFHHFQKQIESTQHQIQGEFHLDVPNEYLVYNVDDAEDEYIENLESLVYSWETQLHKEMNKEFNKRMINSTPLDELQFWHQRSIRLTSILEQMKKDDVTKIIHVLTELDSPSITPFNTIQSQLHNYLFEATDNYKFLRTIERHLKVLRTAQSFPTITQMLSNLMQGLKTIWTMSKHYNKDERFVPFMEKIANELVVRVRQTIDIRSLFNSLPLNQVKDLYIQAKQCLLQWKIEYENTRMKLENDQHVFLSWNFEHRILFDRTDYMSLICDDLIEMSTNLNEFYEIFGSQMKTVTGDEQTVDEILRHISQLRNSFSSIDFDIFDHQFIEQWRLFLDEFRHRSSIIEQQAKTFIRSSFTQLRSSETALDMLIRFQQIDTTHVLANEMIQQFNSILIQYSKEIDTIYDLFLKHKQNPPRIKSYPPIANAIQWARLLFARLRSPMMKFRSVDQLLQSEQGTIAKQRFVEVSSRLKQYETELFTNWLNTNRKQIPMFFKQNLLKSIENQQYLINSNSNLRETLTECIYLEKLSFHLPEFLIQITLQFPKYEHFFIELQSMIDDYHSTISSLDTNEKSLLRSFLDQLETLIQPATTRISFGEISIFHYVRQCKQKLDDLHSILNQLRNITNDIQQHLQTFRISVLDPIVPKHDDGLSRERRRNIDLRRLDVLFLGSFFACRDYFEYLEKKRKEIMLSLKRRYDLIGPMLIKIETLVFGTSTGKHFLSKNFEENSRKIEILFCILVKDFYKYWETEIFNSLVELIIRNLCQFLEHLFHRSTTLFLVNVVLESSRIKLQPTLDELLNLIRRNAHHLIESTKYFLRWLDGTCISCPVIANDIDLTFYFDIQKHPDIQHLFRSVRSSASNLVAHINRSLHRLLTLNDLWKVDKQKYSNRFLAKFHHCSDYDQIMGIFFKLCQTFDSYPEFENIHSIRLSFKQFYQALKYHSNQWIHIYGQHLYSKCSNQLKQIDELLNQFQINLQHSTDTIPDLKFLLNVISELNQQRESLQHQIHQIQQSYRILDEYQFQYPKTDLSLVRNLDLSLDELIEQSQRVQYRLKPIQQRFKEILQFDIEFFQNLVRQFVDKFDRQGPLTVEIDFLLIKQFENEFNQIEQRKSELINMMKLFHIPVINYPQLNRIQKEIHELNNLANLYQDFNRQKHQWSNILWSDLNINDLVQKVESFLVKFRQLSPDLKSTAAAQNVEKHFLGKFSCLLNKNTFLFFEDFRSSLPIMIDLKHEALRDRHWKQINPNLDPTNQILTLENLFQMNLSQYKDIIQSLFSFDLLFEQEFVLYCFQMFYKLQSKNHKSKRI